ncbi:hypothetical protein D1872_323460 [compost metagenome]
MTPTSSVDAVHVSLIAFAIVSAVAVKLPGVVGAALSPGFCPVFTSPAPPFVAGI